MRTALALDSDVAIKAKKAPAKLHKPFKEVYDKIGKLLARAEGEDHS